MRAEIASYHRIQRGECSECTSLVTSIEFMGVLPNRIGSSVSVEHADTEAPRLPHPHRTHNPVRVLCFR
jgi:hypothetical protein